MSSEVFVSVLDHGRDRVCLDAPVPLGPHAQPAIGFDGDRLLVVEQVLAGLEFTAVLREVEVTTSGCEWTRVVR